MWTDYYQMLTNGKMARLLGIDPKTLRKWARRGLIPSHVNPLNGYRFYIKGDVLKALRALPGNRPHSVDNTPFKR